MKTACAEQRSPKRIRTERKGEGGFTIIETSIALVVLMVATLGVASLFVYAINYNTGANERVVAIAIAQQQMERWRKTPFAQVVTPAQPEPDVVVAGRSYSVVTTVDGSATLKRITIQVTPRSGGPTWIRNPVVVITQRTDSATGVYLPN